MTAEPEPEPLLTSKQKEVLDLLLDHMTSKEIGQRLGISHHTVEQRIKTARKKLQASSRSELIQRYRELRSAGPVVYGRTIYEESDIADPAPALLNPQSNEAGASLAHAGRTPATAQAVHALTRDLRVVPEMFEGQHGTFMRVAAILALVAIMLIIGLSGLAIFSQLSALLAA